MIKSVARIALVSALAVAIMGFTQTVFAHGKKGEVIHGDITAIDTTNNTVTIQGKKKTETVSVTADTDLSAISATAKITDLKVGEKVVIHVKPDTTPLVAEKIAPMKERKKAAQ